MPFLGTASQCQEASALIFCQALEPLPIRIRFTLSCHKAQQASEYPVRFLGGSDGLGSIATSKRPRAFRTVSLPDRILNLRPLSVMI